METFGGDLELKRLDLTWSGQVDSVDLTAATLRSRPTEVIVHNPRNPLAGQRRCPRGGQVMEEARSYKNK